MSGRYAPWCLNEEAGFPWGIQDTHTGVNVLGDFQEVKTGAVFAYSKEHAEELIASGRKWQFSQQKKMLERIGVCAANDTV